MEVIIRATQNIDLLRFTKFFEDAFRADFAFAMNCLNRILAAKNQYHRFEQGIKSLMFVLVQTGNVAALQVIINAGFRPSQWYGIGEHKYTSALHLACDKNLYEMVVFLINIGMNANCVDSFGKTPLDVAAEKNNFSIVDVLLPYYGPDQVNIVMNKAILSGNISLIQHLTQKIGNCDWMRIQNKPLWRFAFENNRIDIFKALLSGTSFDPQYAWQGETPLAWSFFSSSNPEFQIGFQNYLARYYQALN